jgi:hypothetical protein
MSGRGGDGGTARRQASGTATFELERFAWGSADRLEVCGRFEGLSALPEGPPALVVHGAGGSHRLAVTPDAPWPPADGETWQAAFVWQKPPAPFEAAELMLGGGLAVELPRPGSHRRRLGRRSLPVRAVDDLAPARANGATQPAATARADGDGQPGRTDPQPGELEVARREAREAQAAVAAAHVELVGAREELEAERRRRAADVERFRDALDALREVGEEVTGPDHGELSRLETQIEAADAELDPDALGQLQGRLDAALESWAPEHEELERLRERNAALESEVTGAGKAREERDVARREVEELRGELEHTRRALEERQRECEHLRTRLEAIREAVADKR